MNNEKLKKEINKLFEKIESNKYVYDLENFNNPIYLIGIMLKEEKINMSELTDREIELMLKVAKHSIEIFN